MEEKIKKNLTNSLRMLILCIPYFIILIDKIKNVNLIIAKILFKYKTSIISLNELKLRYEGFDCRSNYPSDFLMNQWANYYLSLTMKLHCKVNKFNIII